MAVPAPLLAIAVAVQPPPTAFTPQLSPPPPASGGYMGPEQRTAEFAVQTFAFACLPQAFGSGGDIARRSEELGAKLMHDDPAEAAAVTLDGDEGKGCRVRFRGRDAPMMWNAWIGMLSTAFAPRAGVGCTPDETSERRLHVRCNDAASPPHRWEIAVERTSSAADATVAAIVRLKP